jgi:hypothetical protein
MFNGGFCSNSCDVYSELNEVTLAIGPVAWLAVVSVQASACCQATGGEIADIDRGFIANLCTN